MAVMILSPERFKSTYCSIKERYVLLLEKSESSTMKDELEKKRFKKVQKIVVRMKSAYARPKMYAIKNLNALEKYQVLFQDEERAVIVQMVELMEKVILHKKLNREY